MKPRIAGITLIELMTVVAIVSILTAIAYPSYQSQVRRSGRTEAKVALEERSQAFEKCFTRSMAYNSTACANAAAAGMTPNGRYAISAAAAALTYTLTATPQGGQAADAECMNFTLTETGARGVSGSASATPQRCW